MSLARVVRELYGLAPEAAELMAERLAYASFASAERRYLFVETPKAACTSLKWLLAGLTGRTVRPRRAGNESTRAMCIHFRHVHPVPALTALTDDEIRAALTDPGVVRFTTVRNPYARLASAYTDKIRNKEPNFRQYWQQIAHHAGRALDAAGPRFAEFVDWLVTTQPPSACNTHWRPIGLLNHHGVIDYTHVVRIEALAADLGPVLERIAPEREPAALLAAATANENLPFDWRALYDAALADKVGRFFADDFARFGYDRESWRGGPAPARDGEWIRLERAAVAAIRARNEIIADLLQELKQAKRRLGEKEAGGRAGAMPPRQP